MLSNVLNTIQKMPIGKEQYTNFVEKHVKKKIL